MKNKVVMGSNGKHYFIGQKIEMEQFALVDDDEVSI